MPSFTVAKSKIPLYLLTILIFYSTCTRITNYFYTIGFFLLYAVFYCSLLLNNKKIIKRKRMNRLFVLFICVAVYAIQLYMKDLFRLFTNHTLCLIFIYLWAAAFESIVEMYDTRILRKFVLINILLLLVSNILSINVLIQYPYASRNLAGAVDSATIYYYQSLGAAGYGFVYGTAFFSSGCLYALLKKNTKYNKILLLAYIILSTVLVFMASYSIAMISLFVLFIGFLFMRKSIDKWYIVPILLIFFALILVFRFDIINALIAFGTAINSGAFVMHLNQILIGLRTGDLEGELARIPIWKEAINMFISHPIFGSDWNGGHSFVLKHLALFGLTSIPVFVFISNVFNEWKIYVEHWIYKLVISVFTFIVVLNSFGAVANETAFIFLLLPCTLYSWSDENLLTKVELHKAI